MKFKLSQITVLVVSALSVSAGMAATINDTVNINNNNAGPIITEKYRSDDTVKYSGSISNSPNTITFVGRESDREGNMYYSHRTENDGSLTRIGVNYDNNRWDEITVSTGNGTYNDESKQYLDGEYIGDVKKPDNSNATLTIKGTDVTDARLGADKGEYLVATGDTFNGQSSQHLKGKDGKKAVSLDATFTGTAGVKHTGQTVGSNGLAIDSTFDYANQDISSGGVAKNNPLRNGDQNVSGEADNTKITNGNQTVSGKATTNSIDNTTGTHGLQLVSGEATDNTLKNVDQIIEKTGVAVKNVIDNAGAEHGIQVVRDKAEDNTLSNTDQRVEKDGIASVKNDITDGSQFVAGFAENNTITNKATNRGKQVVNGTANQYQSDC